MHKKTPSELLRHSIVTLEFQQKEQELLLREQLHLTVRKINVVEVLLNLAANFISSNGAQLGFVQSVQSILGRFLASSKGKNSNPIIQLATIWVRNAASNFIANHSETIRILGLYYMRKIKDKLFAD